MRVIRGVFLLLIAVSLSGCMTITNQIRASVTNVNQYPSAKAVRSEVSTRPPLVDLSNYKSVETSPNRPYQRPDIAVAIAASGGGYRASNLVVGVLLGLEQYVNPKLKGNLLENVDYISSVSGGGFGVGYYLSRLYSFDMAHKGQKPMPHFSLKNTLTQSLKFPAQKINGRYTGKGNVLNLDLSSVIELGGNHYDDYETALNNALLRTGDGDFILGDVFIPSVDTREPYLPIWVVNSTIYQNMGIFRFAPSVMADYRIRGYRHLGQNDELESVFVDPYYGFKMPYSVALAASSSIPFAMPSTTLSSQSCKHDCYLQLFDGGLSDNLGLDSAYQMLVQDPAPTKLLIVIDASGEVPHAFSKDKTSPGVFSLMWRIMNSGIDASHLVERDNARKFVHAILCQAGAKNVIVAYLDLSKFPQAYKIPTSLDITDQQQQQLLQIGQELVGDNTALQVGLTKYLNGDKKVGACSAVKLPVAHPKLTDFIAELG